MGRIYTHVSWYKLQSDYEFAMIIYMIIIERNFIFLVLNPHFILPKAFLKRKRINIVVTSFREGSTKWRWR